MTTGTSATVVSTTSPVISMPSPSTTHINMSPSSSKDTSETKLFVGGLPYSSTDKSLREHFIQHGEIEEAVVITDRQTGKSKGYGFVIMSTKEGAESACKNPNPIIDGRKSNVNLAVIGAKPRINNISAANFLSQTLLSGQYGEYANAVACAAAAATEHVGSTLGLPSQAAASLVAQAAENASTSPFTAVALKAVALNSSHAPTNRGSSTTACSSSSDDSRNDTAVCLESPATHLNKNESSVGGKIRGAMSLPHLSGRLPSSNLLATSQYSHILPYRFDQQHQPHAITSTANLLTSSIPTAQAGQISNQMAAHALSSNPYLIPYAGVPTSDAFAGMNHPTVASMTTMGQHNAVLSAVPSIVPQNSITGGQHQRQGLTDLETNTAAMAAATLAIMNPNTLFQTIYSAMLTNPQLIQQTLNNASTSSNTTHLQQHLAAAMQMSQAAPTAPNGVHPHLHSELLNTFSGGPTTTGTSSMTAAQFQQWQQTVFGFHPSSTSISNDGSSASSLADGVDGSSGGSITPVSLSFVGGTSHPPSVSSSQAASLLNHLINTRQGQASHYNVKSVASNVTQMNALPNNNSNVINPHFLVPPPLNAQLSTEVNKNCGGATTANMSFNNLMMDGSSDNMPPSYGVNNGSAAYAYLQAVQRNLSSTESISNKTTTGIQNKMVDDTTTCNKSVNNIFIGPKLSHESYTTSLLSDDMPGGNVGGSQSSLSKSLPCSSPAVISAPPSLHVKQ